MPAISSKPPRRGKSTRKASKTPPATAKRAGRPRLEPIRWTIYKAALEFGKEKPNLERERRKKHIEPGSDGKYSTAQIVGMIFTDKALADATTAQANAETAVRRNQREAGELIPTAVAKAAHDPVDIIIRQKICASSLTEAEKDEMLADIDAAIAKIDWEKLARE